MKFNTIIIILITFFSSQKSKAQANYEDVVYLKNKSIIHGTIIEQIPNESIKIETKENNIFVYKIEEIEKITKENKRDKNHFEKKTYKNSGYINITEFNIAVGVGDYEGGDASIGIQTMNGYLINSHFSTGVSVGVDHYKNVTFIPIMLDLRWYILNKKITPVLSAGLGYSLSSDKDNKAGYIANPSLGLKLKVSRSTALNFSFGYRIQNNSYPRYYYGNIIRETATFVNFKTGVSF